MIKCTNVIEVDIAIGAEPKYIENYSIYIDRLTKLTKLKKLRLGDYLKKLPNNIYKLDSLESLTISTKELTPELSRLKYLKKNILYPTFKIF